MERLAAPVSVPVPVRAARPESTRSGSAPRQRCTTPLRAASPARITAISSVDDDGLSLLKKVEADLKALADAEAQALVTLKKLEEDRKLAFGARSEWAPRFVPPKRASGELMARS